MNKKNAQALKFLVAALRARGYAIDVRRLNALFIANMTKTRLRK